MRKRQDDASDFLEPEARPSQYRKGGALALASALLLIGIAIGADQGSRLLTESLQVMASDVPEKQLAKPLGPVKPTPMVGEPYQPERLKNFKPPTPVAETDRGPKAAEAEGGVEKAVAVAAPESEPEAAVSCAGGSALEQDICADGKLVALDRRISSALPSPQDPRYREYLRQREHWCAPQPSRANRQECLLDLGNRLLSKL